VTSALFSPITLRGVTLNNRVVVSPMCQYASKDGNANDWHLMHLGGFSMGAGGLVMAEMTQVSEVGRISYSDAGIYSDDNEKAWKRVVDFCHTYGVAKMGIQIGHAGRKASSVPPAQGGMALTPEQGAWETLGPSPIAWAPNWPLPREMTAADIKQCVADHVSATHRAVRAGFDVIEMHGGHGYLINQFLSPLSNQRTDEYGGTLEKRMRFPLECFEAMRAALPAETPLGIRISAEDWIEGGFTTDDAIVFAKALKGLGVDYICVSTGGLDTRQQIPLSPGYQVEFGARVRKATGVVTRTVGLITKAQQAEDIIAGGHADMIAIGRGAIYDPRWAWHAADELGVSTQYPPKYRAGHPSGRPVLYPAAKPPA
jgi:2,4-dienoyl-CoA reductase-like NADH-dependent reductase (Old Yellow Enzyme family)